MRVRTYELCCRQKCQWGALRTSDGEPCAKCIALHWLRVSVVVFMRPKISVIGIGGAGGNTIDNMIRLNLTGMNFNVLSTQQQPNDNAMIDSARLIDCSDLRCFDCHRTGVNYLAINTDAQALSKSLLPSTSKVQIGKSITKGLGAGARPAVGMCTDGTPYDAQHNNTSASDWNYSTRLCIVSLIYYLWY
jgi:cell division protein FtsZ